MGLFDFLHGRPPKSEAEAYMEKRNKDYARRAAEYRRREALQETRILQGFSDTPRQYKNSTTKMATYNTNQSIQSCIKDSVNKAVTAIESSSALNAARVNKPCDSCNSQPSLYDGNEKDLFEISAASIQSSLRNVIASGVVRRGGFSVGDKVFLKTPSETKEVVIAGIWRQGSKVEYANVASGQIGLVLANAAEITVKAGCQIIKY